MHSSFYYSYDHVIYDMSEKDIDAYRTTGWTEEARIKYPDLESLIRVNCQKLAKALARETHHTTEEWRDTIVVLLMVQLLPGFEDYFDDCEASDDMTQHG